MNKKNIIMFSIAALLLANCVMAMEKDTQKKESHTKKFKMRYESDEKETFFDELQKLPKNSQFDIYFSHQESQALEKELNLFFKKMADLGHELKLLKLMQHHPWFVDWLNINWKDAQSVEFLCLSDTGIEAEDVNEIIKVMPYLKSIGLEGCKNVDPKKIINKNKVIIISAKTINETISQLKSLVLDSCKVTTLKAVIWKKAKKLETLDLRYTSVSANVVNQIIPQLKCLNLTGCKHTSLKAVTWEKAKELETLNLSGTNVTTRMVDEILVVTQLKSITLINCEYVKPEEITNEKNVKIILK